jgi:hypothetical protein
MAVDRFRVSMASFDKSKYLGRRKQSPILSLVVLGSATKMNDRANSSVKSPLLPCQQPASSWRREYRFDLYSH